MTIEMVAQMPLVRFWLDHEMLIRIKFGALLDSGLVAAALGSAPGGDPALSGCPRLLLDQVRPVSSPGDVALRINVQHEPTFLGRMHLGERDSGPNHAAHDNPHASRGSHVQRL